MTRYAQGQMKSFDRTDVVIAINAKHEFLYPIESSMKDRKLGFIACAEWIRGSRAESGDVKCLPT